jgi:uncharacterized protein YciW
MSAPSPSWSSRDEPWAVETTSSSLTEFESLLAAYAASTTAESSRWSSEILARLAELDAPRPLLENIRRAAGRWSVSDDDRIDMIVAYAAKLSRTPERIVEGDIERLRAVGLTDFGIVDLNNIVTYYRSR